MTDDGFHKLVDVLNGLGFALEYTPDERMNMGMKKTASDILGREMTLNRYNQLFSIDTPPEEKRELDNINELLSELIPYINNRETPDLQALSAKYGVNQDEVKEIYNVVKKKME